MFTMNGKGAIVTGASGGIGRAVAMRLARDGFAVVVNFAGNATRAEETVTAITAAGGQASAIKADVASATDVDRLFAESASALGTIDVVNSAGIMPLRPIAAGDVDDRSLPSRQERCADRATHQAGAARAPRPARRHRRGGLVSRRAGRRLGERPGPARQRRLRLAARGETSDGIRPTMHPRWLRCSFLKICPIFSVVAPGHPGAALRNLVLLQRGRTTSSSART